MQVKCNSSYSISLAQSQFHKPALITAIIVVINEGTERLPTYSQSHRWAVVESGLKQFSAPSQPYDFLRSFLGLPILLLPFFFFKNFNSFIEE